MAKMFFLVVDLVRSEHYGLNSTESNLCSVLNFLLSRKSMNVDGEEYYLADYDYIAELCHLLPDKRDTLQRLYKRVENVGLMRTIKIGRHLYFTPSEDLRSWGNQFDNIESDNTEKNPSNTGKNPSNTEKNPSNTEKNPSTYICSDKEEDKEEDNYIEKYLAKKEFSPSPSRTDKVKFSSEQGLTTENLHVKQSVIDKVDTSFSMLHFPFDDNEIKRLFFVLCCSVKWRNKTVSALQLNLNRVSKYEPSYIKKLIEDSIAGGWQGLVFSDTDRKYQDYMRTNKQSTKFRGTTFSVMSDEERSEALEYMNI